MNLKLLKSITRVIGPSRQQLPFLENILIDKDYLYLSNLSTVVRVPHHYMFTDGSGPVCMNAAHFIELIGRIEAPWRMGVDASGDEGKVHFDFPGGAASFKQERAQDFKDKTIIPEMPDDTNKTRYMFDIDGRDIRFMNILKEFTADDELRPVMSCVALDDDSLVASDAHMLYYRKIVRRHEEVVLFKKDVIRLMVLSGGNTFKLYTVGAWYCLISEDMVIFSAIEDKEKDVSLDWYRSGTKYPAWRKVLPECSCSVIIPVREMISALESVTPFASLCSNMVKCVITGSTIQLFGKDDDFDCSMVKSVNIFNPGSHAIEFGMKIKFLVKILKVLADEGYPQVSMAFSDSNHAFLFAGHALIMPMMIND
jgi:DNA polymerase III sliding clamp (beta) subunit (PCNA family)